MRQNNKVLMRKLLTNFLLRGKITTTEKKAKVLKTQIEILLNQAKRNTGAGKNMIKRSLGSDNLTDIVIKQISPVFKDRIGGFVRYIRLTQRESDGSKIGRLEWVEPIVLGEKPAKKTEEKQKNSNKLKINKK